MTVDERLQLITRNLDEVLTIDEIRHLLETNTPLKHYIGFEISGQLHIGSGFMTMMKIKDFIEAGAEVTVFLADWHSWINDKLGGDMEVIQKVGVEYFKHGFTASMIAVGGDPSKINFMTGTDLYNGHLDYWATVIDVSKNTTLARMMRSVSIMGRKEGDSMDFAKLIYPPMQAADIFFQGVNLAHAGMDQRKAHIIARDSALQIKTHALHDALGNHIKPSAVHHHLLLGLATPQKWPLSKDELQEALSEMKMSKSKPDSAVFINDSEEDITRKLNKAFCPEKEVGYNPVLDWAKHLVFPLKGGLHIARPEKWGGHLDYTTYNELESDFAQGNVHPQDVKMAMAESIIDVLKPIRDYFTQNTEAKAALEAMRAILAK